MIQPFIFLPLSIGKQNVLQPGRSVGVKWVLETIPSIYLIYVTYYIDVKLLEIHVIIVIVIA